MNLILVEAVDFIDSTIVKLTDRRFTHIKQVHRASIDQSLKVGLINGDSGTGTIIGIDDKSVTLKLDLDTPAITSLPLTLLLALPRPKMLKRILQSVSSLGVKDIYLINSYKVEKSFWSTPVLNEDNLRENLLLGLEQAGDTIMPSVHIKKRFKPFIEDELPAIAQDAKKLIAHPYQASKCPQLSAQKTVLAIGPEGGFIDYEVERLREQGFLPISLGQRILRVETALPVAIGKLFNL